MSRAPEPHRVNPPSDDLIARADRWSQEAQSVLVSRRQLTLVHLQIVLALAGLACLGLSAHSIALGLRGHSTVHWPWPLLIGGILCGLLWWWVRRRGSVAPAALIGLVTLLCVTNVSAISQNGLAGLTFVGGLVVVTHLLLEPRVALATSLGYLLLAGLGAHWHPQPLPDAVVLRIFAGGVAATVAMQMLVRHWAEIGRRLHLLAAEMSKIIQQLQTRLHEVRVEAEQVHRVDAMTGLPNRRGFEEQTAPRLTGQAPSVVACLRLVRWHASLRHLSFVEQQSLTRTLVTTIGQKLGPQTVIARTQADEFLLHLPDQGPRSDEALRRLESLQEALSRPVTAGSLTALTEPRLGFSRFPADAGSLHDLVSHAETACSGASGAHAARPVAFDLMLLHAEQERQLQLTQITVALDRHEIALDLQPIVSAATGQVLGAEARLAWNHPVRGRLRASQMPRGEVAPALTDRITRWKIQTALNDQARLSARWGRDLPVAVNLPSTWLQRTVREPGDFLDFLAGLSIGRGILRFEVPEESMLNEPADLMQMMALWRAMGIGLVIDHFGAGYSCLSQIDRMPADALKMDRTLVARVGRSPRETAVCRTIVRVAQELRLQVMAEGVQDAAQARALADLGCDLLQGPGVAPGDGVSDGRIDLGTTLSPA